MIYTFDTKREQLKNGYFRVGDGPEKVLVLGSCRTMAFLNYLERANALLGGLTITYINPFDWNWNAREEEVNLEAVIDALETDPRILQVLSETTIFIHEHFGNYGMFNTSTESPKNIYQFGMNPRLDISIPNFHDLFILWNDFASFGDVPSNWIELGQQAVAKFCNLCWLTSFPEFGPYFMEHWTKKRFFWTPNHTSAEFTLYLFRQMNEKFLNLPLDNDFWQQAAGEDMFRDPHTEVHPKDIAAYGLTWDN